MRKLIVLAVLGAFVAAPAASAKERNICWWSPVMWRTMISSKPSAR